MAVGTEHEPDLNAPRTCLDADVPGRGCRAVGREHRGARRLVSYDLLGPRGAFVLNSRPALSASCWALPSVMSLWPSSPRHVARPDASANPERPKFLTGAPTSMEGGRKWERPATAVSRSGNTEEVGHEQAC
jgi:hypothetical protein